MTEFYSCGDSSGPREHGMDVTLGKGARGPEKKGQTHIWDAGNREEPKEEVFIWKQGA